MDHVDFHVEPPANLTTMVLGFGGWIDAGEAATGAIRHLARHLSARRLASLAPEEFFVFTQERPEVRLAAHGERIIQWPQSEFFAWQPPDGRAGLLLFRGMEPNLKWRTYSKTILDVAERCGVRQIVSLGALLAGTPHTRPARVTGRGTDSEWLARCKEWGIYRRPSYEGPTGISSVLLEAATQRGLSYLAFMGQAPHYLQRTENPAVIQAILVYVTRLFDFELDVSEFDEAVRSFRARCDRAVARDIATQEHVRELEQDYDATIDQEQQALPDEELNPERLMQELEDFLREERERGKGA